MGRIPAEWGRKWWKIPSVGCFLEVKAGGLHRLWLTITISLQSGQAIRRSGWKTKFILKTQLISRDQYIHYWLSAILKYAGNQRDDRGHRSGADSSVNITQNLISLCTIELVQGVWIRNWNGRRCHHVRCEQIFSAGSEKRKGNWIRISQNHYSEMRLAEAPSTMCRSTV